MPEERYEVARRAGELALDAVENDRRPSGLQTRNGPLYLAAGIAAGHRISNQFQLHRQISCATFAAPY